MQIVEKKKKCDRRLHLHVAHEPPVGAVDSCFEGVERRREGDKRLTMWQKSVQRLFFLSKISHSFSLRQRYPLARFGSYNH